MAVESSDDPRFSDLRVAIVHYWFLSRSGGERVVEAIAEIFPQADLFALIADPDAMAPALKQRTLVTSFIDRVPWVKRFHRYFVFLQPLALEQFDLSQYDLVISSESGPAKGVITPSSACHICYCHSPMRYMWDMYPQYKRNMGGVVSFVFGLVAHYMRLWDCASANRVDYFVANSHFISSRIRKFYRRTSTVIHPPVNAAAGFITEVPGEFYLVAGRLVDYKRVDLAVQACVKLGRKLKVVGDGPEYNALKRMGGSNVEFLGRVSDEEMSRAFSQCKALLFPGQEDFGIVPVEVQSFGRPVIAYASGGALETVQGASPNRPLPEGATGVFFHEQTQASLEEAILYFEENEQRFNAEAIRNHALTFEKAIFNRRFSDFVAATLDDFNDQRNNWKSLKRDVLSPSPVTPTETEPAVPEKLWTLTRTPESPGSEPKPPPHRYDRPQAAIDVPLLSRPSSAG